MRDDYLKEALKVVDDPNILVNVISIRVKQLRRGSRPLSPVARAPRCPSSIGRAFFAGCLQVRSEDDA
jgi:hypothetical protein